MMKRFHDGIHWRQTLVGIGWILWLGLYQAQADSSSTKQTRVENAVATYKAAMEETDRHARMERFSQAALLFEQLIEGDENALAVRNSSLYVNLGNAQLQCERLGAAIVAFRKALALDPGHTQAQQNLTYARSLLPAWIQREPERTFSSSFFFWNRYWRPQTTALLAAVCFALALGFLAIGKANDFTVLQWVAWPLFLVWGILFVSVWMARSYPNPYDTVLVNETLVYSADSENSSPRITEPLPSGVEARGIQERDRWIEIEFSEGETGWVPRSRVVRLMD